MRSQALHASLRLFNHPKSTLNPCANFLVIVLPWSPGAALVMTGTASTGLVWALVAVVQFATAHGTVAEVIGGFLAHDSCTTARTAHASLNVPWK